MIPPVPKNIKTILFCPLDWGLGHASRDIYIIRKLLDTGRYKIIIGADNAPYHLLKEEFPGLRFIRMPSCKISYSKAVPLALKIAVQVPGILKWKRKEHKQLKKLIEKWNIDMVISDNRYGLWNKNIHSVLITHQLNLLLPARLKRFNRIINNKIRKWIDRFDECWVPDHEGSENLAGKLSHPDRLPENTRYIGPVSRFMLDSVKRVKKPSRKYEVLAILSGPEPLRTELEKLIIRGLRKKKLSVLIVRGLPWQKQGQSIYGNISLVSHLQSDLMYSYIMNAKYILSRAGYTTIMDLAALNKTAVLIPTPGQTEQEYLADLHSGRKQFYKLGQYDLDLEKAFAEIREYRPASVKPDQK